MSSKSNKRKITVEKSGQRPSVFERLGTKAEQRQRDQGASNSGFCRHWNNTGNCPFGSSCKNAMHHILISPSKQRAASKDKDHSNLRAPIKPQTSSTSRGSLNRLHSTVIPVKESGTPPQLVPGQIGEAGAPGAHWEEEWNERSLEHADEKELERRRQQLQRELELQMKKEMRRRKNSAPGGSSTAKKAPRSSSSSSSSSTGSSSSSSGSSSEASSSSRGHRADNKSHSSKQQARINKRDANKSSIKSSDGKKARDTSKESSKKQYTTSSSNVRSNSRNRQRSQTSSVSLKRRRATSSPDSSGSERRKQSRNNQGQHPASGSRMRGRSPSPDRKLQPERKRQTLTHDKSNKRRDVSPPSRKASIPLARGSGQSKKRSATPPPRSRRRSPSPPLPRSRSDKRHGSNSRNASPVVARRRSPSVDRKDSRRGHTPQSPPPPPPDRGYNQRGSGRNNSRRASPETTHRTQQRDGRQRAPLGRDTRQSPDRRAPAPRAASREPAENKRADWGRGRDYGANSPPKGHHRSSPDSSNGSTSRAGNRDLRGDKPRSKDHERDRDRRRDVALTGDKGRDKVRSRAEEGELPSLLSLMTQHPGHFPPQPQSNRSRPLPRTEPPLDHRAGARDRGRFERYDGDRGGGGGDVYSDHAGDEHHRASGSTKRGPPPRREMSPAPRQQRPQKSRDWGEFSDSKGRDWDRRPGSKGSGGNASSVPLRQWGPSPGSESQPRQNRMLPPLSVRNAMQAARRGGATSPAGSPSQQSAAPESTQLAISESVKKVGNEPVLKEKSSDEEEVPQKEPEPERAKEVNLKRHREATPEEEEVEPARKRQCIEEAQSDSSPNVVPQPAPIAPVVSTAPVSSGLDDLESVLSDISDDADDILNAEVAEEPGEIEAEDKSEQLTGNAVCEEEDEDEPVEDILDNMDFEEISDGELEAEEARSGVDALTVDWAALMSQTRSREGEETREARTHRWQGSQLLSRLGVSIALCGPTLASKLGLSVSDAESAEHTVGEAENVVKLLDPVAGVHCALRARRQQRESLFQLRDRRGLSAADDLAFRRQLNGLPAKKPEHQFNQSVEPELFRQAVQLLLAK